MSNLIRKQFRINEETGKQLQALTERYNMNETDVIKFAINELYKGAVERNEELADILLDKFDEKYDTYMTRVRLGTRTAEQNSYTILEALNSFLTAYKLKQFVPISESPNPIITEAENHTKERIAKMKQEKDFRKQKTEKK